MSGVYVYWGTGEILNFCFFVFLLVNKNYICVSFSLLWKKL